MTCSTEKEDCDHTADVYPNITTRAMSKRGLLNGIGG
jgi:hypothetical protein